MAKGRSLFAELQLRLDTPSRHDIVTPSLADNYDLEVRAERPGLSGGVEIAFQHENLRLQEEGWHGVIVESKTSSLQIGHHFFDPKQGSVVCVDNNKFNDGNEPPNRLEWSAILFHCHKTVADQLAKPTTKLKTIWRCFIINDQTRQMIGESKTFGSPRDESPLFVEYRPSDEGFFALLGCPNGKGIVRLCTDHSDALGRKTIACVRVLKGDEGYGPALFFVLENHRPPTPAKGLKSYKSSGKLKREKKKAEKNARS